MEYVYKKHPYILYRYIGDNYHYQYGVTPKELLMSDSTT